MTSTACWRFDGHIAGAGTLEGTRLVLGCWMVSPLGRFADVMVERSDGHRVLLAPDAGIADFVASTYVFDEVQIVATSVERTATRAWSRWRIAAGPLNWTFVVGPRTRLGMLMRGVPGPLARSEHFARVADEIARRVVPGVRTHGTAGGGRTEWYAPSDIHAIRDSVASWGGEDLGAMAPIHPPARFGFSSTPPEPSLTELSSVVRLPCGPEAASGSEIDEHFSSAPPGQRPAQVPQTLRSR